jgi:putative transcriptional regulator
MIRHHPDDALLLGLAADRLARGPAVVTATHVERCAHCRARLRDLDAIGGALLEDAEPAVLSPEALARTLARIDAGDARPSATPPVCSRAEMRFLASLPAGMTWPRSLRRSTATPWRWLGPGMRWSRVTLADDPAANVFLLRIAAGKYLPQHTHRGLELTQILYGRFHDGRALFGPGDFDAADAEIHHQPAVQDGSECICLGSLDGRLRFESPVARLFGSLVGM